MYFLVIKTHKKTNSGCFLEFHSFQYLFFPLNFAVDMYMKAYCMYNIHNCKLFGLETVLPPQNFTLQF